MTTERIEPQPPVSLNHTRPPTTADGDELPHPLANRWFLNVDGKTYGPYTGYELEDFAEEGRIEFDTQVCRQSAQTWTEAGEDTTLRKFFAPVPVEVAKPPLPPVTAKREQRSGGTVGDNNTGTVVNNTVHVTAPAAARPVVLYPGSDKSPGLALFLSLIFVGLGQIYNGEVGKGIGMFILCALMWVIMLGWIVNLWSIIDAYSKAKDRRTRYQLYMNSIAAGQ